MATARLLDLHFHSLHSDGTRTPAQLAEALAADGVSVAALTDHNTVSGLAAFRHEAMGRGVAVLSGLELTVRHRGREWHLLAYGFDAEHGELNRVLENLRPTADRYPPVPPVWPSAAEAIALVHRAGGIAVLAHPTAGGSGDRLPRDLLQEWKAMGLDGFEGFHGPSTPNGAAFLEAFARESAMVITGGSDAHGEGPMGIRLPDEHWRTLRARLLAVPRPESPAGAPPTPPPKPLEWRGFFFHFVVPAVLAYLLFMVLLLAILLPALEKSLVERKRETIRELTAVAWGVLSEADAEVKAGVVSRAEAQARARDRIGAMRYGREKKDYFWLQDLHPRMVMHPWRPDLDGQDLSTFQDARGVRIFQEFVAQVKDAGEGYVRYVWQWKDDPGRLAAKESYLRLFAPWGWIIGTGLYVEDVAAEVASIRRKILLFSGAIAALMALLLLYLVRESLVLERRRNRAEVSLTESRERYRALASAANEGVLFVSDGRCRYANPVLLEMIACDEGHLPLFHLEDLLEPVEGDLRLESRTAGLAAGESTAPFAAKLHRTDGQTLEGRVTLKRVDEGTALELMVLFRREGEEIPVAPGVVLGRILDLPTPGAEVTAEAIARAPDLASIRDLCRRVPAMVRVLLEAQVEGVLITRQVAAITDAATARVLDLTEARLGPAPRRWAFLAMGSQGRMSQTLSTDQDNALIFADGDGADPGVDAYFEAFSREVCDGLREVGYEECPGNSMARNPRWRRSLTDWRSYVTEWMAHATPQEVVEFGIFHDFRPIRGGEDLARELKRHIHKQAAALPRFIAQMALQALEFKAPPRLFGSVVATGGEGEHNGQVNLKAMLLPVVLAARVYCLRHGILEYSTAHRLKALARAGVLEESRVQSLRQVVGFLLRLRLEIQLSEMERGLAPDNWISPAHLSAMDLALLKASAVEIDSLQERIRRDFLAGV